MKKDNRKKRYLFFNMSEYREWEDGVPNRNRHVLFEIAKKSHVFAVDFMPFTLRRALKIWLTNILRPRGEVVARSLFDVLVKKENDVYVYSSVKSALSEKWFNDGLKKALKRIAFQPDVVWSYFPYFISYFDDFPRSQKVFDAVDDWSEHENFISNKAYLKKQYADISKKADVIFTVSDKQDEQFNVDSIWIPNGVDFNHFQDTDCRSGVRDYIEDLAGPIVGYVGIIQKRIDFKLVAQLARKFSEAQFVFVGPVWPDAEIDTVNDLENVHFPGKVSYEALPGVLSTFNVGIIPHKVNAFTASMNPLKLYEYLSVGIPVVTTPVAGIETFDKNVYTAASAEFGKKLEIAFSEASERLALERKKEAQKHSWQERVQTMISYIEK